MLDRRAFLEALAGAWMAARPPGPGIDARPTALYQQPDGRSNLVRITVAGVDAPAARARLTDRRGALVGTAGLLPVGAGLVLRGELWVPLGSPAEFQVDVEVGRQRVARQRVRLAPPRRWTLYWTPFSHLDVGGTDLQERALEAHHRNLDAALSGPAGASAGARPGPENTLALLSFLENRPTSAGDALLRAIREGRMGFPALYANLLTGLLDHETFARVAWPAGLLARERGLSYVAALANDVQGHPRTFPSALAASGVRYLASAIAPERGAPARPHPQLYYWEAPDGARVLHWRALGWGDGERLGFDTGPDEMARRISEWLLDHPVFASPDYPYDAALLLGTAATPNASWNPTMAESAVEFNRRYAFPRIVPARLEEFFRDVERRHGPKIPVRRGDTGAQREAGAAAAARELAVFRTAQLGARVADALALWDQRLVGTDPAAVAAARLRAEERRVAWADLLRFSEHTWGAAESAVQPDSRQTVVQWAYKRRMLEGAAAAVSTLVADGLLRLGRATEPGAGRLVFNASAWPRADVVRVWGGAGERLRAGGVELPSVDETDGSALVAITGVPALGYVALRREARDPQPPVDEGEAIEAQAGGMRVRLDQATGAIASWTGPDGAEQVRPGSWSGLNQFVYATGAPPAVTIAQNEAVSIRRERLPGIGVRLRVVRRLAGLEALVSMVTLYDDFPWVDIENHLSKPETLHKEALYVAFPFALAQPTVELEVPLGRMTVERDQQAGSSRGWYCHTHWVWLTEGERGVLWSGPDTPLLTFNDIARGAPPAKLEPDGTLFAAVLHNYAEGTFPARQGGVWRQRFRLSLLPPGDRAEPVRRGWAACDPLWVSAPYDNTSPGPLLPKDRAVFFSDPSMLLVGAKPADDGEGAVLRVLDVSGSARPVSIWPAAYRYVQARRTNLVEMNEDPLPVASDGRVTVALPAWGVATLRLFTPRESVR